MDGVLRRVSDGTWAGTLHGCAVQVFHTPGRWHFAVIHPGGWTVLCPPCDSPADGARRARAWVEARVPRPAGQ
jgi:hypothetical protein